jgi:hypothetical protein
MDKVQRIDRSNTAPSSKTFRDEELFVVILLKLFYLWDESILYL